MRDTFERLLRERILILDGAMGTMIQGQGLDEAGYRGHSFRDRSFRGHLGKPLPGGIPKVRGQKLKPKAM